MYSPNSGAENLIIPFLISVGIILGIFFAVRGLMLWYYRVNERIALLERNNELLTILVQHFVGEEKSNEVLKPKIKKGLFIQKEIK